MEEYFQKSGLSSHSVITNAKGNLVRKIFSEPVPELRAEKIKNLFIFDVPKLGPNGSCSITHEKEDKPYNLAETLSISLSNIEDSEIQRIWRLKQVVKLLQEKTKVDWLGVYRKITKKDGSVVLLKEAYVGRFSRAEFPLTEEFAKGSNNSTVGLTGKAVVLSDVESYSGPYYECDAQVKSEVCSPIFSRSGEVIGIIDAESFQKNFFDSEKIAAIASVCYELGEINFGLEKA